MGEAPKSIGFHGRRPSRHGERAGVGSAGALRRRAEPGLGGPREEAPTETVLPSRRSPQGISVRPKEVSQNPTTLEKTPTISQVSTTQIAH